MDIATLNRAARDFLEKKPAFALEAALAALHWLAAGKFYEITSADVHEAVQYACEGASKLGRKPEILQRLTAIAEAPQAEDFVRQQIKKALGLS